MPAVHLERQEQVCNREPANLLARRRAHVRTGLLADRPHRADVLVISLVAAPQLANLIDSRGRGWLVDTAVFAQALLLTQGVVQLTKFSVGRGAPLLYDESVPLVERQGRDASRSFVSGHTSTAFMAASSYTVTYWLRHPESPWRWVVLAGTRCLATFVGLLKIQAGYHYPTDIAAGALVGSSIGVLTPMLHRRF